MLRTMKCRRRQLSQWEEGEKVKEHVYSQAGNPTTASLKAYKDAHYWAVRNYVRVRESLGGAVFR